MRVIRGCALLLCVLTLSGCYRFGNPFEPIPSLVVNAPINPRRLVVVLPGRADDVTDLQRSAIAQAVQSAWPDADVVLTELAIGYYIQGRAEQRLHDEVMVPARRRGYGEVWLVGASLGGMGAVMYDRAYPNEVDGMVLLAPYLGNDGILSEIAGAGGVARWQAPASAESINLANYQRQLWRHLQSWSRRPAAARKVWLVYGKDDRLRDAMPLISPILPPNHVLLREGGHDWTVWSPATKEVLLRINEERG